MKSLKQQSEELSGVGFYDPRITWLKRDETELFNKVSKFLIKVNYGCIVESSYIYSVYNKIWSGEMTFNQLKKQFQK